MSSENANNQMDPATAKLWENKLDLPHLKLYLKNGGSTWDKKQPYLRSETIFDSKYDLIRMKNVMFDRKYTEQYNKY